MENKAARAIFLGVGIFGGFVISNLISGKSLLTVETILPALVGGLVAALVVYFFGSWSSKKKK